MAPITRSALKRTQQQAGLAETPREKRARARSAFKRNQQQAGITNTRPKKRVRVAPQVVVAPAAPEEPVANGSVSESDSEPVGRHYQRPSGGIKPTDDYQDEIVVRSVETADGSLPVGVEHYLEELNQKPTYDNIGYDFVKQYCGSGLDAAARQELNERRNPPASARDVELDSISFPRPRKFKNHQEIFMGDTCNPLVPLAIVRIAQRNLPSFNFNSALDNLPNMDHDAPFPSLPTGVNFLDSLNHEKKPSDDDIYILFIPDYYKDGRHCIGFWCGVDRPLLGIRKTMLFTPCRMFELEECGLAHVKEDGEQQIGTVVGVWYNNDSWNNRDRLWCLVNVEYPKRMQSMMRANGRSQEDAGEESEVEDSDPDR